MGLKETEAFVLRSYKLAEADKIVVLLTLEAGLLRGVARGARRLKSRFGASLEPFTHISLTYHEREGRELVSISQTDILRSHFHLAAQAEVVHALDYFSQMLCEFAPPAAPDERLFRLVKGVLGALADAPGEVPAFTRYFDVWLLKLSGFLPEVRRCAVCQTPLDGGAVLNANSSLQCRACAQTGGLPLSQGAQKLLRAALRTAPGAWAQAYRAAGAEEHEQLARLTQLLLARALERLPRAPHAPN
ncbi:MAG TPA: DNA repair protein RecO [Pyrinomonadaceae bacterium]|jgi:DNA repair protein RecO (recombination protein O)